MPRSCATSARRSRWTRAAAAAWNRQRLDSQQRFAVTFPAHPESATLLTRTAREYYDLKDLPKALEVAGLVLARQPPVDAAMQRTAWTVTGNAQFDTGRFADAEGAYLQVQSLLAAAGSGSVRDQRAARGLDLQAGRGEAGGGRRRRRGGRLPARRPARAGRDDPRDGGIRRRRAARVAQGLAARDSRARIVPRRLPVERAPGRRHAQPRARLPRGRAHGRGGRASSSASRPRARRRPRCSANALWQAAELYEKSSQPARAMATYESYVARFPAPLPEAIEARLKLADHAGTAGDYLGRRKWLEGIVAADRDAGGARTDRSRYLAAVATLELTDRVARRVPVHPARRAAQGVAREQEVGHGAGAGGLPAGRRLRGRRSDDRGHLRDGRAVPPPRRGPDEVRAPGEPRRGLARAVRPAARGAGLPVRGEGGRSPRAERAPRGRRPLRRVGAQELRASSPRSSPRASASRPNPSRSWPGSSCPRRPCRPRRRRRSSRCRKRAARRTRRPRPRRRRRSPPATEQQFAQAVQLLEAGDFAGARPLLEALVASEPALAAPAVNLGMLHARERRWSEAEAALAEGYPARSGRRGCAQRACRRAARERALQGRGGDAIARRWPPTRRTCARTAISPCCSTSTCGVRPRRCSTSRPTCRCRGPRTARSPAGLPN